MKLNVRLYFKVLWCWLLIALTGIIILFSFHCFFLSLDTNINSNNNVIKLIYDIILGFFTSLVFYIAVVKFNEIRLKTVFVGIVQNKLKRLLKLKEDFVIHLFSKANGKNPVLLDEGIDKTKNGLYSEGKIHNIFKIFFSSQLSNKDEKIIESIKSFFSSVNENLNELILLISY